MKKIFMFMALTATVTLLCVSCKKDEKSPEDTASELVGSDWQGYISGYKKNGSEWVFNNERNFAVVRFTANADDPLKGKGYQLEYENENKYENTGKAEFTWNVTDDKLHIAYITEGWGDVYLEYNKNCEIKGDRFSGEMFDYHDHKYVFEFWKTTFYGWEQFFQL